MIRLSTLTFLVGLTTGLVPATAQPPAPVQTPPAEQGARPARTPAPTRDPHAEGYVAATELADGANASPKEDGNFILGSTHPAVPEMRAQDGVPHGMKFRRSE